MKDRPGKRKYGMLHTKKTSALLLAVLLAAADLAPAAMAEDFAPAVIMEDTDPAVLSGFEEPGNSASEALEDSAQQAAEDVASEAPVSEKAEGFPSEAGESSAPDAADAAQDLFTDPQADGDNAAAGGESGTFESEAISAGEAENVPGDFEVSREDFFGETESETAIVSDVQEDQTEEDFGLAEEASGDGEDDEQPETLSEEEIRKAEQGSTPVNVNILLDFSRFPASTRNFLTNEKYKNKNSNPIQYYTVKIRDCQTGETLYSSGQVRRKAGAEGVMSLQPVTYTAAWDMGDPDPDTGRYSDFIRTYAVSVSIPHFKPIAEKYVTLTVKQKEQQPETDESETDESETDQPETDGSETDESETDQPETDQSETDQPETEQPETARSETEEPGKLVLPAFTFRLNADGVQGGEEQPDVTLSFAPEVEVYADPLTPITVSNLARVDRLGGRALEGGTITPEYIISSFLKPAGALTNPMILLDRKTLEQTGGLYSPVDLGHSNDMTYIASANEIYTTPVMYEGAYRIVVFDASTLQVKRRIKVDQYYGAISYDETRDCFFLVSYDNSLLNAVVYSGDFTKKISAFSIRTNLTYQGCGTWNGLLYFTAYENGSSTFYEAVPDGRLKAGDNVIMVYDLYGHLLKTYYLPASGDGTHYEAETVMFDEGRMIIQFNEKGKAGYYMVDPEENRVTLSAAVSVKNSKPKDGQFKAGLYLNGKRLKSVSNKNGAFTFSGVKITQPGSYLYQIRQDKGRDTNNIIYSDDAVSILVTALYDPYTNQLTVSSSYQSGPVIRNYHFTKKEKKKLTKVKKARPSVTYLKAGKKKLKVKYRKVSYAQGYQIQICRSRKFRGKTLKTFRTRKLTRKITKLTKKKRYYVRVRAYLVVKGKIYYSKYSKVKSVRVK